jgi:hypothetical protein
VDVIPEDAGNPEISPPLAVFPVDGCGVCEGCPSSGAEVDVGVPVGYGSGGDGSPSGGGGGGGAASTVTCEDVEMMLDGSDSLEAINALQMASPENSSTTIAANTTIFFFIFCFVTPYFLYRFFIALSLLCATCNLYAVPKFSTGDIKS